MQTVQERAARELEAAHERARRSEEQLGALGATIVQTGANTEAARAALQSRSTASSSTSAVDEESHGKRSEVLKDAADAATQRLWECQAQLSEARRSNALLQAELAATCDEFESRVAVAVQSSIRKERHKLASEQRAEIQKHVRRALAKATLDRERMLVRVRAEMAEQSGAAALQREASQQSRAPDSSDVMMI